MKYLLLLLLCSCSSVDRVRVPGWQIIETETDIVVINGAGGPILDALRLSSEVIDKNKPLRITLNCFSSCTIAADKLRRARLGLVCVEKGAIFAFHQGGTRNDPVDITEYYDKDIVEWVDTHGGWPIGYPATYMYYDDLIQFYRPCD